MPSYRFYPDKIKPFPNEPTKDKFQIVDLGNAGFGLKALVHFNPGRIANFTGEVTNKQDKFTIRLSDTDHLFDPYFIKWITHSCEPNIEIDRENMCIIAIKEIFPNDIISFDYELTEGKLSEAFDCNCGFDSCRGYISGEKTD